ncbi:ImmA/IrrE family metallo-endopeptidase [Amphibacillus jilinensis]|uniref:ImmA/IrrE family metallo-endopeptidase n=1 Tax=Amphibacillus jilinensis TaxID=1216008 RepID=UPI0002FECFB1|nr:toxin [Amphibacillus jilinensis]
MLYEDLISKYSHLTIEEVPDLPQGLGGLYFDNVILLDKYRNTREKYCLLTEELGHYHTSAGDITDQSKLVNRKQEVRARSWGFEKAIPLEKIVQAYKAHVKNRFELAEFLDVTESYLEEALERYIQVYGICVKFKNYVIRFDPLGVTEMFI